MEIIRKEFDCQTKYRKDTDDFVATVSTGNVDRDGDILEPEGANFKDYNKVILYRHNRTPGATAEETLPVGRALWDKVKNGKVKVGIEFNRETKLSELLHKYYKEGWMEDWSVGFTPVDTEPIKSDDGSITGRHIRKYNVHEISAVPIASNQYTTTQRREMKEFADEVGVSDEMFIEIIGLEEDNDEEEVKEELEGYEVKSDVIEELKREIIILSEKVDRLLKEKNKEKETGYSSEYLELLDSGDSEKETSTSQELEIVEENSDGDVDTFIIET